MIQYTLPTTIFLRERVALAVFDGLGAHSLGRPGLGLAVSDGAVSFRTVSPGAWAHASEVDRPGLQMLQLVTRWLPRRQVVIVADSSFAALDLLAAVARRVPVVTRLRRDAALYEHARQHQPNQIGRPQLKGNRLPTLAQAAAVPVPVWIRLTLPRWSNRRNREVEVAPGNRVRF